MLRETETVMVGLIFWIMISDLMFLFREKSAFLLIDFDFDGEVGIDTVKFGLRIIFSLQFLKDRELPPSGSAGLPGR